MTTPAATAAPMAVPVDPRLAAFVFLEARLADEAQYSDWEALWADDALYWVPMHPDDDPGTTLSYLNDNRQRIHSRIAQLKSGVRHSQTPPSVMRRVVSNLEVVAHHADATVVAANFALFEYRYAVNLWAGRTFYTIRTSGPDLQLVSKIVHLVNAGGPIPTMAFLV